MSTDYRQKILQVLLPILFLPLAATATASDHEDLTNMLNEFLAAAETEAAHERFWAEDLIYTSSSGTRTTKAEIMAGFAATEEAAAEKEEDTVQEDTVQEDVVEEDIVQEDSEPGPVWLAEDIQIQLHGETAVVAFKLVGTTTKSSDAEAEHSYYFNTGTFVKRDGIWKVTAWQATVIPAQ
jgi:hypothetical protein